MHSPPAALSGHRLQLAAGAVLFGVAFVPAHIAVRDLSPWGAVSIRFVVAALLAVIIDALRGPRPADALPGSGRPVIVASVVAGAINVIGFCTLSLALERTTASNAAFLSSMSVVIIPVVAVIIGARRPTPAIAGGVALAVLGSFLLSGASLSVGSGDALAILDAFIAAGHISAVGWFAQRVDATAFNRVQLIAAAGFAVVTVAVGGPGTFGSASVVAAAVCGVLQVAALGLQVSGQSGVDATSASMILLLVPLAGAFASIAFLGDRFDLAGVIGAIAIVAAVVVAELIPARRAAARRRAGGTAPSLSAN